MKGFISYAHTDLRMCRELHKRLTLALEHLPVTFWWDPQVQTGEDWSDAIAAAMTEAQVFVVLVSNDSLASDYIRQHELPAMLARRDPDSALILPVLLEQCFWQCRFQRPQLAPMHNGKPRPILDWKPQRNGYHAAADQVAKAVQHHYNLNPAHHAATVP